MSCSSLHTWSQGSRHPGPPVQDKPCWNAAFHTEDLKKAKIWCQIPAAVRSRNVSNMRQRTTWPFLLWALCISHPNPFAFLSPKYQSCPGALLSPTQICPQEQHLPPLAALLGNLRVLPLPRSLPSLPVLSSPLLWSLPPAKPWFLLLLLFSAKIYCSQGTLMQNMKLLL